MNRTSMNQIIQNQGDKSIVDYTNLKIIHKPQCNKCQTHQYNMVSQLDITKSNQILQRVICTQCIRIDSAKIPIELAEEVLQKEVYYWNQKFQELEAQFKRIIKKVKEQIYQIENHFDHTIMEAKNSTQLYKFYDTFLNKEYYANQDLENMAQYISKYALIQNNDLIKLKDGINTSIQLNILETLNKIIELFDKIEEFERKQKQQFEVPTTGNKEILISAQQQSQLLEQLKISIKKSSTWNS